MHGDDSHVDLYGCIYFKQQSTWHCRYVFERLGQEQHDYLDHNHGLCLSTWRNIPCLYASFATWCCYTRMHDMFCPICHSWHSYMTGNCTVNVFHEQVCYNRYWPKLTHQPSSRCMWMYTSWCMAGMFPQMYEQSFGEHWELKASEVFMTHDMLGHTRCSWGMICYGQMLWHD